MTSAKPAIALLPTDIGKTVSVGLGQLLVEGQLVEFGLNRRARQVAIAIRPTSACRQSVSAIMRGRLPIGVPTSVQLPWLIPIELSPTSCREPS